MNSIACPEWFPERAVKEVLGVRAVAGQGVEELPIHDVEQVSALEVAAGVLLRDPDVDDNGLWFHNYLIEGMSRYSGLRNVGARIIGGVQLRLGSAAGRPG